VNDKLNLFGHIYKMEDNGLVK